jgi:hypothetical protein
VSQLGITQGMCTSFKVDLLSAGHNFSSSNRALTASTPDIFYIALYSVANGAALDVNTTSYTTVGEISGSGYTAGGQVLNIINQPSNIGTPNTTAYINFANPSWVNASFSADGALIYNSSNSNKSVIVLAFGGTKTATNNTFTVIMPATGTGNSIVQIQ